MLVALNNYVGKSSEQALNELTDAGFEVIQRDAFSDTYPLGSVISQKPDKSEIPKGGKVTLTISKGPEQVKVPTGILKLEEGAAVRKLEDYGFTVKVLKPAKVQKGKKLLVIKVLPAEGALVKPNSMVITELGLTSAPSAGRTLITSNFLPFCTLAGFKTFTVNP